MITRAVAGTMAPRNGLPGFRPYVYRGTGEDTLTPRALREQLDTADVPVELTEAGRCAACGYRPSSRNHKTLCGYR